MTTPICLPHSPIAAAPSTLAAIEHAASFVNSSTPTMPSPMLRPEFPQPRMVTTAFAHGLLTSTAVLGAALWRQVGAVVCSGMARCLCVSLVDLADLGRAESAESRMASPVCLSRGDGVEAAIAWPVNLSATACVDVVSHWAPNASQPGHVFWDEGALPHDGSAPVGRGLAAVVASSCRRGAWAPVDLVDRDGPEVDHVSVFRDRRAV
jgi:hypothetical protein